MKQLMKVIGFCAMLALTAPAFGQVRFDINVGPPAPYPEVVVAAPFAGAVWVPGYHRWDYGARAYVWVPGVWQHPPYDGARWVAPRYAHRGGHYGFVAGHWGGRGGRGGGGGHRR